MFNSIMVPVDGSKYSDKAVNYAIAIACKFNSKIIAVHVLEESSRNNYDDEENKGDFLLGEVTKKANDVGVDTIEHLITGDPLRDMTTIVKKSHADLVVMHAFGTDTFDISASKNNMGSVSERVMRTGDVPVLIIK